MGLLLLAGGAPVSGAKPQAASAPADGISFALSAERTDVYPREEIQLSVGLANKSDTPVRLPIWSGSVGVLHLKTPDGQHFVIDCGPATGKRSITLKPGWTTRSASFYLELIKAPPRWRKPDGKPADDALSFETPGKYTFRYRLSARENWQEEHRDPIRNNATFWTGPAATAPLTVTVHRLTAEAIRQKPTPQEMKDLQTILKGSKKGGPEVQNAYSRLRRAMLLAANDGLAGQMVKMLRKDQGKNPLLHNLLLRRAMRRRELRFTGTYLRDLVELELDRLRRWCKQGPPKAPAHPGPGAPRSDLITAYFRQHDAPILRQAAIELALKNAGLPDIPKGVHVGFHHYQHARLEAVWSILGQLDALKGRSIEELKTILGKPAQVSKDRATWYYPSTLRIRGPHLRVELKDGKAVGNKAH